MFVDQTFLNFLRKVFLKALIDDFKYGYNIVFLYHSFCREINEIYSIKDCD